MALMISPELQKRLMAARTATPDRLGRGWGGKPRPSFAAGVAVAIALTSGGAARAEEPSSPSSAQPSSNLSSLPKQSSLTDTPDGPKEALRELGIMPDVWITQFYQGQTQGSGSHTWRYGGKLDAFLKVDAEKLGLWQGLHANVQYEHYIGDNLNSELGQPVNRRNYTLLPVNTAEAYVREDGYHSALSISVTQDFGDQVSVSAGKFNMMTLASRTPLLGGGGIDTFMNRAFALPSTGVSYTARGGGPGDRVVISAPYLIGGIASVKTEPISFAFVLVDPRSAIDPRVIERPFEKGVAGGGAATLKTDFADLQGFHTVRVAYSNARGIDLDSVDERPPPSRAGARRRKRDFGSPLTRSSRTFFKAERIAECGMGALHARKRDGRQPKPGQMERHRGPRRKQPPRGARERPLGRWFLSLCAHRTVACRSGGVAREPTQRGRGGGVLQPCDYALAAPVRRSASDRPVDSKRVASRLRRATAANQILARSPPDPEGPFRGCPSLLEADIALT